MNKISDKAIGFGILGLLFAAMTAVVFLLRRPQTPTGWVGYLFFLAAVVFAAMLLGVFGSPRMDAEHTAFTQPVRRRAFLYVGAAGILTVLFTLLLPWFSWKAALCVEVVVTLSFWGLCMATGAAVRRSMEIQAQDTARRLDIRALSAQMRNAAESAQDPALQEKLSALAEDLQFSPLGTGATQPQDDALWNRVTQVLELVRGGKLEEAARAADALRLELSQRNRGCML